MEVERLLEAGRLGRFHLKHQLGRGAFGAVFLGWDPRLARPVALKVVPVSEEPHQRVFLAQFLREARSAARLDHPNIVRVYEAGEAAGHAFIAMERVSGGHVGGYVKRHGPLAPRRAAALGIEAARALAHAHEAGILHQDVKPGNLLLSRKGHAKLADFGLARMAHDHFRPPWKVAGTPAYLAPEAARGEPSEASDLYSLAVTIGFLLTGRALRDALAEAADGPARVARLRAWVPEAPAPLLEVLAAGLDPDPSGRPPDGEAFARRLRDAVQPRRPEAQVQGAGEGGRRLRWLVPAGMGAGGLALAGILVLVGLGWPGRAGEATAPPADLPVPARAAELLRVGRDDAVIAGLAYAGRQGPVRVGGRVTGVEEIAGARRLLLGEGSGQVSVRWTGEHAAGRWEEALVVARGVIEAGPGGRLRMTNVEQVRRLETEGIGAGDRPALETLARLGAPVRVRGRVLAHREPSDDVVELDVGEAGLIVRYERRLFSAMTRRFGGYLGSGIVGEQVAVRGTPRLEAGRVVLELSSTRQIETGE